MTERQKQASQPGKKDDQVSAEPTAHSVSPAIAHHITGMTGSNAGAGKSKSQQARFATAVDRVCDEELPCTSAAGQAASDRHEDGTPRESIATGQPLRDNTKRSRRPQNHTTNSNP